MVKCTKKASKNFFEAFFFEEHELVDQNTLCILVLVISNMK